MIDAAREARPADHHGRRQGRRQRGHSAGRRRHRRLRADARRSSIGGKTYAVRLPLVGEFQIENALVAAGLAIATGSDAGARCSPRWNSSKAPRAGWNWSASATARRSSSTTPTSPTRWPRRCRRCGPMRRGRLVVVFGAGGDRDAGKRPLMGAIAARECRPRHRHRRQSAQRKSGRDPRRHPGRGAGRDARSATAREAIRTAIAALQPGDVLLIAGKGHETGQIVGDQRAAVQRSRCGRGGACGEGRMSARRCGPSTTMAPRCARDAIGALPEAITGISIDSRSIAPGEAYLRHQGRRPRRPRLRRGRA